MSAFEWSPGGCCCVSSPGLMDFYCHSAATSRMSSTRHFSRVCSTNTLLNAGNGRQIEGVWGVERTGNDKHRSGLITLASWDGASVYSYERSTPAFLDVELNGEVDTFNDRLDTWYPIIDPDGSRWEVHYAEYPTRELATFQMQRADVIGTYNLGFGFAGEEVGIVLRLVDEDNFLMIHIARDGTAFTIQRWAGGTPTIIATNNFPLNFWAGFQSLIITITFSCIGQTIVATASNVNGSCNVSTNSSSSYLTATKFGLRRVKAARISRIQVVSSLPVEYLSAYHAGTQAQIAGANNKLNQSGHLGYDSVRGLAVGEAACYIPRIRQSSGDVVDHYGGGLVCPGAPFGSPTFAPSMSLEPQRFTGQDYYYDSEIPDPSGVYFAGGQEVSSGGARTFREHLPFKRFVKWHSTGPSYAFPFYDFFGNPIPDPDFTYRRDKIASYQQLGKETIGHLAKYGYPKTCGRIMRNAYVFNVQPPGDANAHRYSIRGEFAMVIGDLTWPEDGSAPYLTDGEEVHTWTMETSTYAEATSYQRAFEDGPLFFHPPPGPPIHPAEEDILLLANNAPRDIFQGVGPIDVTPVVFDCTPDLQSYVCYMQVRQTTLPDGSFGGSYNMTGVIQPWFIKSGGVKTEFAAGVILNSYCISPTAVVVDIQGPGYPRGYRIYSGGSVLYSILPGSGGIIGAGGARCMSDRFVYLGLTFNSEANARAFSTVTLPTSSSLQIRHASTGASWWAISYDGSIRYPLIGINQGTQYLSRLALESDNFYSVPSGIFSGHPINSSNADCIKMSDALPFAPPLSAPVFV